MKLEMIFMTAVLGIAAIHLIFNLVNYLSRFKSAPVQKSCRGKVRGNWYVFFDTSVLYGDTAHEQTGHRQKSFALYPQAEAIPGKPGTAQTTDDQPRIHARRHTLA